MKYFSINSIGIDGGQWKEDLINVTEESFCANDEHIFALTLNFRDRSQDKVESSLWHYINVVSRMVFKSKQRRSDLLVKHFAVIENHDNKGFHSHATIAVDKTLLSAEDFKKILLESYKNLQNKSWANSGIEVVEYRDSGWNDYIHKNRTKEHTGYLGSISLSTLRLVETSVSKR